MRTEAVSMFSSPPPELLTQISRGQRSAGSVAWTLASVLDGGNDVDKWIPMFLPSGPEDGDGGIRPSSALHPRLLSKKTYQVLKNRPANGSAGFHTPPSLPAVLVAVYFALIILLAWQKERHPNGKSKASLFDRFDEARLCSSSV